ncbi:polyketide synthase [Longispora albida]|uniref:beta-ketoacyl [acyl carrier protein] synthase domain-containing protein n=1 Tax=Longispora albida TaxID=203523 RepID=UPI000370D284|nr:polyketide synthase [Longispora albida]
MRQGEPIAIVGIGCRFPGASHPDELWRLLLDGSDQVVPAPPPGRLTGTPDLLDPRPRTPGRLVSTAGGFLAGLDEPVAAAMLTEREALAVDPQHRVLLAVAADALADAGTEPAAIEGREVGVFMGQSTGEHWDTLTGPADMYSIAGAAARSMASGRISYALDLRGPCATVDAACSSGTLAVHLARQSLLLGECDVALAGGVSLVLGTDHTLGYSAAGMLSPTGRCAFGSDHADGFVRADGAAVLVLKPLSRALADGDRIHATILGSAQASKGRTAKAIIAPSVDGYLQVIDRAAATAGVSPADIGYVEAHGNAAPSGDTLELQAIGAAIGQHRASPCLVGSVKTNLGHSEAAGGLAGLIKTAYALRHRTIPASLHAHPPTSAVDWAGLGIAPVTRATTWPGERAVAGLNTYGLSGTFVHLVLGRA